MILNLCAAIKPGIAVCAIAVGALLMLPGFYKYQFCNYFLFLFHCECDLSCFSFLERTKDILVAHYKVCICK